MAKKLVNKNYITPKEARRLFTKFLMENNCLMEYIVCYRYFNSLPKDLCSPSWIIDDVIHKLRRDRRQIGFALENIATSFEWSKCQEVMCHMHGISSLKNDRYAYNYWYLFSKKLYKYINTYVEPYE